MYVTSRILRLFYGTTDDKTFQRKVNSLFSEKVNLQARIRVTEKGKISYKTESSTGMKRKIEKS